ncbi:MAG: hypothetical protein HC844_01510 [Tabrizicola sp.]|nr:hypothetical protein [Tabrizicola sp.]
MSVGSERVTIVNRYIPRHGAARFVAAATALARRVKAEGDPGVRSYQFFCAEGGEARAVVAYDSPEAWVGHHDIAMGWPEMAALREAADLVEIAIHGPLSEGMRAWLERAEMMPRVCHHGEAVAGFLRTHG